MYDLLTVLSINPTLPTPPYDIPPDIITPSPPYFFALNNIELFEACTRETYYYLSSIMTFDLKTALITKFYGPKFLYRPH